jgi:hypothetical protein
VRLTAQHHEMIRELRYMDGLSHRAIAERVGCSHTTVRGIVPGPRPGMIPNAPLREAFLASGRSACSVAREIGWMCRTSSGVNGDGARVRRALGIIANVSSNNGVKRRSVFSRIDAEFAALIAEAIGVAPWEIGYAD